MDEIPVDEVVCHELPFDLMLFLEVILILSHQLSELPLKAMFEVELLDNFVWYTAEVEKNDDEIRLFVVI